MSRSRTPSPLPFHLSQIKAAREQKAALFPAHNMEENSENTEMNQSKELKNTTFHLYKNLQHVKNLYLSSTTSYKNACSEYIEKKDSLENFKSTCQKNATPSGPGLPTSLKLQFVERTSFPTIESDPEFFKKDLDILKKLQVNTTTEVYTILLAAKDRHVEHLMKFVHNTEEYVNKQTALFRKRVEEDDSAWIDKSKFKPSISAGSAASEGGAAASAAAASAASASASISVEEEHESMTIPIELIVADFRADLKMKVSKLRMDHFTRAMEHENEKRKRRAEALAAEEKVKSGKNTKEIIIEVSKKTSEAAMATLQKELNRMKEKLRTVEASAAAASGSSSSAAAAASSAAASPRSHQKTVIPKRSLEYSPSNRYKPDESPFNKQKVDGDKAAAASSSSSSHSYPYSASNSSNRSGGDRYQRRGHVHDERRENRHYHASSSAHSQQETRSYQARPRESEKNSKDPASSSK